MQVAQTILQQLGGNRFVAMTGAKNLVGDKERRSLSFKLPRGARNGINYVRVTLTDWDTYIVDFFQFRKLELREVSHVADVYAGDLARIFTEATGLDTRL